VSVAPGSIGTALLADLAVTEAKRTPLTNSPASGVGGNPTASDAFLGATASVTLATSRPVFMVASKAFGSSTGGTVLTIWPCYQLQPSGAIQKGGLGISGLTAAASQRHDYSISYVFPPLPAGTYTIGMCGSSSSASSWDSNDAGYVSAIVL
jgi:hypothetical protein